MQWIQKQVDGLYVEMLDMTPGWVSNPETIVFHHGVGANLELWDKWIPVLAPHYQILRFDMRGFGRSVAGVRPDCWTMPSLAQDVVMLADEFAIPRFHFVGESIGGTIGLVLALNHLQRLISLTVSNAAYRGGAIQNVSSWHKVLMEQGAQAWSKEMMEARFYRDGITVEQWQWFEHQQASHPLDSIVQARNILVDSDLGNDLARITIPVLLLHGDNSPFVPVDQMVDMHKRLPNNEMHIFGHAKHGLPFSHGKECADLLSVFLKRQR